jgi:predicted ABC-type ATPase
MSAKRQGKASPRLYVIAGPNGAGKTTFATKFLPAYAGCREFVNADLIAGGLSPFAPEKAAFSAGRLMLAQIRSLGERGVDFAFETTLSGKSYLPLIRNLKIRGYAVHLFFLWIPSVELALARVAGRVREGGHNVPDAVVRRRFAKGLLNLFHFYRPLLDSWTIFDNSSEEPRIIVSAAEGELRVADPAVHDKIQKELSGHETE